MDVSDNRPVVALITAKTCGHCHTFKSNVWAQLKPRLESDARVRIVEIDLEETNALPDKRYPQDLSRFVRWFPMLLIASGQSWNDGLRKVNGAKLEAAVYNGQVTVDRVTYQPGPPANQDNILKWLDQELRNPAFVAVVQQQQQRPKVVFTNDGRPVGRPDVVPTVGSVCNRKYIARHSVY